MASRYASPSERLWAKVVKTPTCWLWTGARMKTGHGFFKVNGRVTMVYRHSYEIENGPIPNGLVIDHICRNPPCVRPSHLRAVTQKQNMENRSGAQLNSKTGIRGVQSRWPGRWDIEVKHRGVRHRRRGFHSAEDAERAAITLRNELFTCNDVDRKKPQKT